MLNPWLALGDWAPKTFSAEMRDGFIGMPLLIRDGAPLLLSDLELLIVPGLAAMGIDAAVETVTDISDALEPTSSRKSITTVFQLSEMPPAPEADSEAAIDSERETMAFVDPEITEIATDVSSHGPAALLHCRRALHTGLRSVNISSTLLRWAAFAAANQARLITSEDGDKCSRAAQFLAECVDKQSNPSATRIRRAICALNDGEIETAFRYICEGALLKTGVSAAVRNALLKSGDAALTGTERRELIYLARAGTAMLKVLAVHRLAADINRSQPDISSTLQQMQYDGNAWVRAAAKT